MSIFETIKKSFEKTVDFLEQNLIIAYSLFLLAAIPAAFFVNNYIVTSEYDEGINSLTRKYGGMVESIINVMIRDKMADSQSLQENISLIMNGTDDNSEEDGNKDKIAAMTILVPQDDRGSEFKIIASSDPATIGNTEMGVMENKVAWALAEGVAGLDVDSGKRVWKITKSLTDADNRRLGLLQMSFSLDDSDRLVNKVISKSYWTLGVTILFIVLLIANQTRLVGYVTIVNKLKEVDRMKDMFISMASHELRTPLTAIKGYLDLLKDKKEIGQDPESGRYMDNISMSTQRLASLVEDMLEVSRIEGNRLPMEITSVNPVSVIFQCVEEVKSQAVHKGLDLKYERMESSVKIAADESRLKQVLVNLIGNSIKYTEKGSVEVTTSLKKGYFLITVADTGIGMSSEDQANLFQKFYRIKNAKTRDIVGTGLGLWITNEIVKKMNGKITVESIEGVGSHFTVYLPLAKK